MDRITQGLRRVEEQMRAGVGNKNLSVLCAEEKDVIQRYESTSKEIAEAAKYFELFGVETGSNSVTCVTKNVKELLIELAEAQRAMAKKYEGYRLLMKGIRTRQESLSSKRQRRKELDNKVDEYKRKGKPLGEVENELKALTRELQVEESDAEYFLKVNLRDALKLKFEAFVEFGQKLQVLGDVGVRMADCLPTTKREAGKPEEPFNDSAKVNKLLDEALAGLRKINQNQKPTLSAHPSSSSVSSLSSDVAAMNLAQSAVPVQSMVPPHGQPVPPPANVPYPNTAVPSYTDAPALPPRKPSITSIHSVHSAHGDNVLGYSNPGLADCVPPPPLHQTPPTTLHHAPAVTAYPPSNGPAPQYNPNQQAYPPYVSSEASYNTPQQTFATPSHPIQNAQPYPPPPPSSSSSSQGGIPQGSNGPYHGTPYPPPTSSSTTPYPPPLATSNNTPYPPPPSTSNQPPNGSQFPVPQSQYYNYPQ